MTRAKFRDTSPSMRPHTNSQSHGLHALEMELQRERYLEQSALDCYHLLISQKYNGAHHAGRRGATGNLDQVILPQPATELDDA
jgi:hypothetical protein